MSEIELSSAAQILLEHIFWVDELQGRPVDENEILDSFQSLADGEIQCALDERGCMSAPYPSRRLRVLTCGEMKKSGSMLGSSGRLDDDDRKPVEAASARRLECNN